MPDQEVAFLEHKANLWATDGSQDRYSQPIISSTPVQVACRWNQTRSLTTDAENNVIVLDATVVVAQPIITGSWMQWLLPADEQGSSSQDQEIHIVKTVAVTYDIKGQAVYRQLGLMRLRNQAPSASSQVQLHKPETA